MCKVKYFPHDARAISDPKIQKMIMEKTIAAYGVYWAIVEALYERGGKMEMSDLKLIAHQVRKSVDFVSEIVTNYGLFLIEESFFVAPRVNEELTKIERLSIVRSNAAKKRVKPKVPSTAVEQGNQAANAEQMLSKCSTNAEQVSSKLINRIEKKRKSTNVDLIKSTNVLSSNNGSETLLSDTGESDAETTVFDEVKRMWNDNVEKHNLPLSKSRVLNGTVQRKIKLRIKEMDSARLGGWRSVFEAILQKISSSDFLQGKSGGTFKADLAWVFCNDENWVKIYEGRYDNNDSSTAQETRRKSNYDNYSDEETWGGYKPPKLFQTE